MYKQGSAGDETECTEFAPGGAEKWRFDKIDKTDKADKTYFIYLFMLESEQNLYRGSILQKKSIKINAEKRRFFLAVYLKITSELLY